MINYYLITKPGIIMGNLFTVAAGFLLASKGEVDFRVFIAVLLGLGLIIASACIFNNYIDRHIDMKMERTKNRPLVNGAISIFSALTLATFLGALGTFVLYFYTNVLALSVALIGFSVYIFLYSFWKCRTVFATAIGSIAGAVPPVVGYCAASNSFDLGALLLFIILVLWQMPHFQSIAIFHLRDYSLADIPVLPVKKGIQTTKIHMVIYILAFIPAAAMLTFFGYTGNIYLISTLACSLVWLALALQGFKREDNTLWGKQMFRWSLVLITAMCCAIPL